MQQNSTHQSPSELPTAQAVPGALNAMVRYCPSCCHVGEVPPVFRNCCPDGNSARYVAAVVREEGFKQ